MSIFRDGACALTMPAAGALGSFVVRGGRWEAFINTRGQGFGQRPDPELLRTVSAMTDAARAGSNVRAVENGFVRPIPGRRIDRLGASSELLVTSIGGKTSGNQPYVLDGKQWQALSQTDQIRAVSAYAVTANCSVERVRAIGTALRDGRFVVVHDSVEATLAQWCAGETPGQPGPTDDGAPGAPSGAGTAAADCGSVTIDASPPYSLHVVVTQGNLTCEEATGVVASSVQPGPLPIVCDDAPGQRPTKIMCKGTSSVSGHSGVVAATRR